MLSILVWNDSKSTNAFIMELLKDRTHFEFSMKYVGAPSANQYQDQSSKQKQSTCVPWILWWRVASAFEQALLSGWNFYGHLSANKTKYLTVSIVNLHLKATPSF